ncbi:unnamed protein product [Pieris macdunnoughi]|uniref:Uncharacterized protein n=1 Tax=Pieris macdunnoughi TaxID=345717 RepID=A0A821S796_9NEOP|nr:unnamed protein product [Pieris macdunnoughi]
MGDVPGVTAGAFNPAVPDLRRESAKVCLKINSSKTKSMTNIEKTRQQQLPVDISYHFIYLGHKISLGCESQSEVDRRISQALEALGHFSLALKRKVFHQCIPPVLLMEPKPEVREWRSGRWSVICLVSLFAIADRTRPVVKRPP